MGDGVLRKPLLDVLDLGTVLGYPFTVTSGTHVFIFYTEKRKDIVTKVLERVLPMSLTRSLQFEVHAKGQKENIHLRLRSSVYERKGTALKDFNTISLTFGYEFSNIVIPFLVQGRVGNLLSSALCNHPISMMLLEFFIDIWKDRVLPPGQVKRFFDKLSPNVSWSPEHIDFLIPFCEPVSVNV